MRHPFFFYLLLFFLLFPCVNFPLSANQATTVAIVDFTNNSGRYLPQIGESASEILGVLLVENQVFNVVERQKLRTIMEEQSLVASGLVDNEQSAIEMGKLLGADLVITGSVLSYGDQV